MCIACGRAQFELNALNAHFKSFMWTGLTVYQQLSLLVIKFHSQKFPIILYMLS